jgi:hypothetical protein
MEFSSAAARTMLLASQGLVGDRPKVVDADAVLDCIRRMGVLQIDTIHVVARSPYLVLWSRLGSYEPALLDGLLSDRRLFEYWSHEACFIPMERYPLYRRMMLERRSRSGRWVVLEEEPAMAQEMLALIAERGTVRSSDFERKDGKSGGWWSWKHEKLVLECLHTTGHLMIARRERFQRVYALRERVLPDWSDEQAPHYPVVLRALTEESVRCLGVAPAKRVADYFRLAPREVLGAIEELASDGTIHQARIEGVPGPAFVHASNLGLAERVTRGEVKADRTVLLSPFDPVVWDRDRSHDLFGFDYRIECYTPAAKRKYGYFVLPILHRDVLVGRLDAKAHRADRVFEVRALHLEPSVIPTQELVDAIGSTIGECASWHGTPKVVVARTEPRGLARKVQAASNRKKPKL